MNVLQQMGKDDKSPLLSAMNLAILSGVGQGKKTKKRKRGGDEKARAGLQVNSIGRQLQPCLGTVKSGAPIHKDLGDTASTTTVLCLVPVETELEVCDITTEGCRCVLTPGFGFGWARHEDLVQVNPWTEIRGSSSSLAWLEIGGQILAACSLLFLAATGQSLTSLVVSSSPVSSTLLDDVSQSCPLLTKLSVHSVRLSLRKVSIKRFFSQPPTTTHNLRRLDVNTSICDFPTLAGVLSDPAKYPAAKAKAGNQHAVPGSRAQIANSEPRLPLEDGQAR